MSDVQFIHLTISQLQSVTDTKERRMLVRSNEKKMIFHLDADEDAAPFLRELQRKAPALKIVVLNDEKTKTYVLSLYELDLDHWSLSRLNATPHLEAVGGSQ